MICDLNEGYAVYRPRYIVPNYDVYIQKGCKFLELPPPKDLDECLDGLLILYSHIPSITSFPVFIGNLDALLDPFIQDEEGDYIKVKSVGLFYEVNSIKNRSTSLQGSSFWQLTLVPMKEENSNVVDDRNGEADKMREIAQVGKQRKEDLDLFDMSQVIEDEHNDIAFTPKEQPEVTERVDNKYDDITGQRGFNKQDDDTLLNWD